MQKTGGIIGLIAGIFVGGGLPVLLSTAVAARTAQALYKVPKALLAALGSPTASFRWLSFFWSNQFAQLRLHRNPGFVVKPFKRYLNENYKFPDRVRSLVSHYEFAVERLSSEQLESIHFGAGLILAEFHGKSGVCYRVVLGTHSPPLLLPRFVRPGRPVL